MRAVIPHFKGDVPPPSGPQADMQRQFFGAVTTGLDPQNGRPLDPATYLEVLRDVRDINSAVAQNVARVFASSLAAEDARRQGEQSRMFFLEGCTWDWTTGRPRTGAEVSRDIHAVLPQELRAVPTHVEALTRRTRDEFGHMLRLGFHFGMTDMTTVTHSYHTLRTRVIGGYMKRFGSQNVNIDVRTPSEVAVAWEQSYDVQPAERFALDAIRIAEPSSAVSLKERMKEYGPLLSLHLVERLTGYDVEGMVLKRMAVRNAKSKAL